MVFFVSLGCNLAQSTVFRRVLELQHSFKLTQANALTTESAIATTLTSEDSFPIRRRKSDSHLEESKGLKLTAETAAQDFELSD